MASGSLAKELARLVACPTLTVPDNHDVANSTAGTSFREILCASDFSPMSIAALKQALVLAQQSGGRLTALHVLDGFPHETASSSRAFGLIDEYRGLVAQVSRQLRNAIPQDALNWCDVQTRVVSGVPHRAILSTALEIKPDLIVMGLPARSAPTLYSWARQPALCFEGRSARPDGACPSEHREPDTVTPSRAPALDSDLYPMVPGRASQPTRIGGLASR